MGDQELVLKDIEIKELKEALHLQTGRADGLFKELGERDKYISQLAYQRDILRFLISGITGDNPTEHDNAMEKVAFLKRMKGVF